MAVALVALVLGVCGAVAAVPLIQFGRMVAADLIRASSAVLADVANYFQTSPRLTFARERFAAHRAMLVACELEVDDARMQTLLGQLVLGDLARFDADEAEKRTRMKKISRITTGKTLVSKGGDKFFTRSDTQDVIATALAIHEAVPCGWRSEGRGREQTFTKRRSRRHA